jgi:hypothetical protein
MISSPSTHRNRLQFCCLALLAAVFLFGLHYKLSLYYTSGPGSPETPPAKLLSEAENPSSLQAAVAFLVKSQLKIATLPAAPAQLDAGLDCGEQYAQLEVRQAQFPATRTFRRFSSRPPPKP